MKIYWKDGVVSVLSFNDTHLIQPLKEFYESKLEVEKVEVIEEA
jgi:hypothetical protein